MKAFWIVVLLLFVPISYAEPIQCGAASFDVAYQPSKRGPFGWEQITLTITNGQKKIARNFEWVHFEVACLTNSMNKPYIVYQAYCGGSGCRDFDNWGIVEPSSLKVLLEPDDYNHKKAEKIFGGPLKPF